MGDDAGAWSEVVRAGVLPFSVAQDLNVPCAYERSVKITPAGLLTNRYLIAIDTQELSLEQARLACVRLGMPAAYLTMFCHRYARASQFMMGFEEGQEAAVVKIYLESRGFGRPAILSHVGWKWRVGSAANARLTLYRRVSSAWCIGPSPAPLAGGIQTASQNLIKAFVERATADHQPIVCLALMEAGQYCGLDLNVYSLGLDVAAIAPDVDQVMSAWGLSATDKRTLLSMCGTKHLGHLSVGAQHLTLYYV